MSQNLYHHYVDGSPTPETGHTAPQYQWLPSVPATLFAPPVHPGPSHSHPGPSRSHPGPTRFRFENQFQHSFSGAGSTSSASLRAALGDATGTTLNTQRTDATRKRAVAPRTSGRARKRRRQGEPAIVVSGPVPEVTDDVIDTDLEHPAFSASRRKYGSLVSDYAAKRNTAGATDVGGAKTRPKTAFVGCRFCIDEWHVWSNTNPQTATIREHLISKHYDKFRVAVLTNKLKGWETFGHAPGARGKEREPFSLEGFYERFVRWIAVDDQIGMVTLDNASNCGSMMEFVALLLRDMGVYFDKEGNEFAVKAGLKQLTKLLPWGSAQDQDDDGDDFECDDDPATQLDIEADDPYMEILRG
ncbi:hypothetical protein LshimejAT787_2500010 [Lyophyllum shimeji]|uniref:Uncharacterized protein n=1 Tax=Lyophyllum shimeji TaxID=47721 RepID=A0A9P3URX2_LYOSH|nr:hypothetical protein LshimejAT787_2500010 [Lyophyllum shimeji]